MEMLAELSTKLRDPFGFTQNQIEAVVYDLKGVSRLVQITGNLQFVAADPDDG